MKSKDNYEKQIKNKKNSIYRNLSKDKDKKESNSENKN